MRRPPSVGDRYLREEGLGGGHCGLGDTLAETGDLADLLEEERLAGLVAVNAYACRVIAPILETRETIAKRLANTFSVLGLRRDISTDWSPKPYERATPSQPGS